MKFSLMIWLLTFFREYRAKFSMLKSEVTIWILLSSIEFIDHVKHFVNIRKVVIIHESMRCLRYVKWCQLCSCVDLVKPLCKEHLMAEFDFMKPRPSLPKFPSLVFLNESSFAIGILYTYPQDTLTLVDSRGATLVSSGVGIRSPHAFFSHSYIYSLYP